MEPQGIINIILFETCVTVLVILAMARLTVTLSVFTSKTVFDQSFSLIVAAAKVAVLDIVEMADVTPETATLFPVIASLSVVIVNEWTLG
jgi:hypothetical protein